MKSLTTKFSLTPDQIRALVIEAVDASIVDILGPVVDRSVTIALITTRQLVLKDFAFDGNTNKVKEAADQIVQNLAGSLALVTCREPLRISLQNNLLKNIKRACQNVFEQEIRANLQISA
jgi:CCR4-NOT transcription complex subunit 1